MKHKFLFLLPLSALLLWNCSDISKDFRNEEISSEDLVKIYASFLPEEGTRTSLGEFNGKGFPYRWDDADAIGVFSVGETGVVPTTNAIFKYQEAVGDEAASFIGTPQILKYDNIWAYYPWSSNTVVESGRNISLSIRASQNYNFAAVPENPVAGFPNGSFGQGEAPAVAWGEISIAPDNTYTFNLSFKPVGAYLTIPITGEAEISSVGISVKVGEEIPEYVQLAGTLNIDMSKGEAGLGNPGFNGNNEGYATLETATTENGGIITLDCGRGVELDPETPTWFWFVVPANMPTTSDTKVTIYVNGNPEFLYTFNRNNNASPIGRNQTLGLSLNNTQKPFVYDENGGIPDNMELAFPDPIFREYVLSHFDTDGDGIITEEEALKVNDIYCSEMGIQSLQGIGYFTNLTQLVCSFNQLTTLDVSHNTALTWLTCDDNQLTTLDVSSNIALNRLYCQSNQLTTLDISHNTALTHLSCIYNQLSNLDVSRNTALTELHCFNNQLTTLDVSNNIALIRLYCNSNQLTTLDVSHNSALLTLWCSSNQLSNLDVSHNTALTDLSCENNQLRTLDLSINTALTRLICNNNQLTTLDLSHNIALTSVYCHYNQLTTLDLSHNTALTRLDCGYNQLSILDVSYNTALTYLSCSNNQLTTLDVSNTKLNEFGTTYPLYCCMESLQTLYLKEGWEIEGININRNSYYIYPATQIEYKN